MENLLCLYNDMVLSKPMGALLQFWIDNGTLEENLKCMVSTDAADRAACHEWFLSSNQLFLGGERECLLAYNTITYAPVTYSSQN